MADEELQAGELPEFDPNEGGELIPAGEPTITLTMQDGALKVDRFMTLDAAETLGYDLIKHVAAERAKFAAQQNNGGDPNGEG